MPKNLLPFNVTVTLRDKTVISYPALSPTSIDASIAAHETYGDSVAKVFVKPIGRA
jgi:hypothetical protein